jgi:hypothetical protein
MKFKAQLHILRIVKMESEFVGERPGFGGSP